MSASPSRLQAILDDGRFVVTGELDPPDTADPERVLAPARKLAAAVDAVNVPDGAGGHTGLSGLAAAALLVRDGIEPVMHLACRDRNRIALQADLLGAAALGIRNVLCLTGDDVSGGDQPEARRVFDLDSVQLLRCASVLNDGNFLSGRQLQMPPRLFLGAACNPFAPPFEWRPARLAKKEAAGARFVQTQFCFDPERLRAFMSRVRDLGLHRRLRILVGVGPLPSLRAAEYLRDRVAGVAVPEELVDRLRGTPESRRRREGNRIFAEIVAEVRTIPGVAGIHVMAHRLADRIEELLEAAELPPRDRRDVLAVPASAER